MSPLATPSPTKKTSLPQQFCSVRQQSESLCEPLSPEDMMVQSCPEASPAKWHLAHTTWFFETFLLRERPGYRSFDPNFYWLFNSYYNSISDHPEKKLRASFSRPSLNEVMEYRRHVDAAILQLLEEGAGAETERRIVLGLNHEQQHQELLLTDIKHALWTNPLRPSYDSSPLQEQSTDVALSFLPQAGGLVEIGHAGDGFCYDNETPRHRVFLEPFEIASRPISCGEFLAFMEDGGYRRPELWLSDGWDIVQREKWCSPLYWFQRAGEWFLYTLRGEVSLKSLRATPVCHVSYYEADAYAHWAGQRLPSEAEWEAVAATYPVRGNLLESKRFHPSTEALHNSQFYGDVWEWTSSAYLGYPGFQPLPGALGEYNGKFMSGTMVLRGGSCTTPASHLRETYRNFFHPSIRWQFSGIRLAKL
jgi:ergothioneine biosynthesis protein EgtB